MCGRSILTEFDKLCRVTMLISIPLLSIAHGRRGIQTLWYGHQVKVHTYRYIYSSAFCRLNSKWYVQEQWYFANFHKIECILTPLASMNMNYIQKQKKWYPYIEKKVSSNHILFKHCPHLHKTFFLPAKYVSLAAKGSMTCQFVIYAVNLTLTIPKIYLFLLFKKIFGLTAYWRQIICYNGFVTKILIKSFKPAEHESIYNYTQRKN